MLSPRNSDKHAITMLYNIICSRIFYKPLLSVIWLCNYNYDIYKQTAIDIMLLSYHVTYKNKKEDK